MRRAIPLPATSMIGPTRKHVTGKRGGERWQGLRGWFFHAGHESSQAELLRARARSAVPQLLGAIALLNERRNGRSDRSADFRVLAVWLAISADDSEAHRLARAAFALNPARHFSLNTDTDGELPASTPWAEAPPLKIHPRLREYGEAAHACSANWLRKRCRSKLPATASQLATPRAFRIGATRAIVDGIETGRVVALPSNHAVDAIRVILGPQADHFSEEQIAAFLAGPWQVSARGDRMAYFLEGPRLSHALDYNIVSDGIAMGAIQVPGEGQPIVQMADRQPTGGYAKIATIIGPDLGRFAQMRAGAVIRFHRVEHAGAVAACAAQAAFLNGALAVEPLMRTRLTSEFLLGLNLVDGCVDALRQHRS